jgi:galactosylceramidase
VDLLISDPELSAAIAYVGGHDAPPSNAQQTGKPVWFSEDFHSQGGEPGSGIWASQINRRWIQYNMTATIAWNAIDAFYPGLAFDNTGLMTARNPWSGNYEVLGETATTRNVGYTATVYAYMQ